MSRAKSRRTPNSRGKRRTKASGARPAPAKAVVAEATPQVAKQKALPSLSLREFADLVNRAPATVSAWCEAGMPHAVPGKSNAGFLIRLEAALPWVLTYALEPPKESQRERLAREQADKVAIENAQRRGDAIDADTVGEVLKTIASTVSAQLEAIPSRCANELAGITDPVRVHTRLREEHRGIRSSLAGIVGRLAETCERVARNSPALDTATAENGGPVGGREASVTEGLRRAGAVSEPADALHGPNCQGGIEPSA